MSFFEKINKKELDMNECYFFGVWSPQQSGHFLYDKQGYLAKVPDLPCCNAPDGVFLNRNTNLYIPQIWNTDGWTVYAMWDHSGDKRPGSSSTFIIRGDLLDFEAWDCIVHNFPTIAERISNARKNAGM